MRRNIFDEVHDAFRATARAFFERDCAPNTEKWERDGKVSREAWRSAGEHGLIGWALPEKYGGMGIDDFRFNQIVSEEMFGIGSVGIGLGGSERHPGAVSERPDHRGTEGALAGQ